MGSGRCRKGGRDLSEEKIKETEAELKQGIFTMDAYLSRLETNEKMGHGRVMSMFLVLIK